jgi:hypothetical protein
MKVVGTGRRFVVARNLRTWPGMVKRLLSRVIRDAATECWNWQGARAIGGYGSIRHNRHNWMVHRVSWIHHYGVVPDNIMVLHHCDNPSCCNPAHLFLGTNDDNMKDMARKGRANRPFGEKNGRTHLTAEMVMKIMKDNRLQREIAVDYGIARSSVSRIKLGKPW